MSDPNTPTENIREVQGVYPVQEKFERYDGPNHATPEPGDEAHRLGTNPPESARKPLY